MPLATLPCDDHFEIEWLKSTKARFAQLSELALRTLPVSRTYCYAGIEPERFYNVTYGSIIELHNTLHTIYVQYGPVDLLFRGRDTGGKWYLKCAQPGHKYGPAKEVICVSPPKDGSLQDIDDWEKVVNDIEAGEDDWVKV